MRADLRLAIVTDIHHGEPKLTKRGDRALDLLDRFLAFCADYGPDPIAMTLPIREAGRRWVTPL